MKRLSWFEAMLVGFTLTFVGLLVLGVAMVATRQSALGLLGALAAVAALTVLAKLVSRLGRKR